jgi:hypothetical protein
MMRVAACQRLSQRQKRHIPIQAKNPQVPINVSALSGRAFWQDREVKQGSPGAFDKAVSTWPLTIAVDAGPMEIQLWEGAVLRCAGTGPRRAVHENKCQETGEHKKVSR